jgi:hypothetical protein
MQRYTDLNVEELELLTEAQIQKFIDIEIAFAGVQMVPKPLKTESFNFQIKPKASAFYVKGVLVADKKVAEVLQNAVVYRENYTYPDYDHKYLEEQGDREIAEKEFYLKDDLAAVKSQIAASKKAQDEYNAANKIYCEYEQQVDAFQTEVLDAVNEARRLMGRRRQAQAAYDKYMDLADGDDIIACKFFLDAFAGQPDMIEYVLGEVPEQVDVAA